MNLITNTAENSHLKNISQLFSQADQVFIAVAFLKKTGLTSLQPMIRSLMKRKGKITIICGLDFALTEPAALRALFDLFETTDSSLKLFTSSNRNVVFHPKAFCFENKAGASIIIGSANLTGGGMERNEECSIQLNAKLTDDIYHQVKAYFNKLSDIAENASLLNILQYDRFFQEQVIARRSTMAKPTITIQPFNYSNLQRMLQEYRVENDVDVIFADKSEDYRKAKGVLDSIADTRLLTRANFIPLFERLVGGEGVKERLWHSGSIYRKKTTVFDHPAAFQRLVRFIRDNRKASPSFVFEQAKKMVAVIPGSGVNTVTEIMMTYNPVRFANLNKNPITVLREVGKVALPASRNSFSGMQYQLYAELVAEISRRLELRNMLEADSFFNDIYWKL